MCINDQCYKSGEYGDDKVMVMVDTSDGYKAEDLDVEEAKKTLSAQTGIRVEEIVMGWSADEKGDVIRVLLYFENEEDANSAVKTILEMKDEEGCQHGKNKFMAQYAFRNEEHA